jgi:acyl-CoA reductase-like NAD-dependent aldehyde dehydrogenase
MADKVQGSVVPVEPGFLNYVTREPVGVVGQIVPWNFPGVAKISFIGSTAVGRRIIEASRSPRCPGSRTAGSGSGV